MNDMVTVQLNIPQEWLQDVQDPTALLEILSLGLEERRIQRALRLYQQGAGSLGYVAELVNISKRVLMEEARRRGCLPQYEEHLVERDLFLVTMA
jgi:predicted HTH domain antitoxin